MRVLAAKVESLLRRVQAPAPAPAPVPVEAVASVAPPPPPAKQVVVFMHGKGGVGTTTLAVNVGVALATSADRRVTLLDLDLPYGNAAKMLGLSPELTLTDLAGGDGGHVSNEALQELLLEHRSGVRVLVGADTPERASKVSGLLTRWAIERALADSDVVLVDTATWWSEATLAALAAATTVCVVTTPRLVAMESTASCLAALERAGLSHEQVRLVLNNTSARGLKAADVVRRLERTVDLEVPFLSPFADAARALRPLDRGQTDQIGAIVARDLASRVVSFPAA
jgi:pilus assembly protein CpaE